MTSFENILATLVIGSLIAGGVGCGSSSSAASNPPETVEYATLRLDFAGRDGVDSTGGAGTGGQRLVGEPSPLAAASRASVFGTNRAMDRVFWLIRRLQQGRPTVHQQGTYTWVGELRGIRLRLSSRRRSGRDFEYGLWVQGPEGQMQRVLDGSFARVNPESVQQQGSGIFRFDFDVLPAELTSAADARAGAPRGRLAVAFRREDGVKRLQILRRGFAPGPDGPTVSGLEGYRRGLDGGVRYRFLARRDLPGSEDRQTAEFLRVDAAWTADGAGRAAAAVQQGDVRSTRRVETCWDTGQTGVWATSQPSWKDWEGGARQDCDGAVRELEMQPPEWQKPGETTVEIPADPG